MPYTFAFLDTTGGWPYTLDMLADFVFITDLLVTAMSAFYDEDNLVLETSNKRIFSAYLKSWFFVDIVACFPVNFIEDEVR